MSSETIYQSDKKQSITKGMVADVVKANAGKLAIDQQPVPTAGVYCGRDEKHGLMLMSAKDGTLECGPCGYKVAAP